MHRTLTLPWPGRPITLADWAEMPEDEGYRLEVAEGVLVPSLSPRPHHQKAVMRVAGPVLDQQLPPSRVAVPAVELLLCETPLTIRVPDIIVIDTSTYERNPPRVTAPEVRLAVEILSDGTRRVDRVMKFSEYAEAGIPQYWLVDLHEPATLVAYVLVDGEYELSGEHTGEAKLTVAGHPITIDLAALTSP